MIKLQAASIGEFLENFEKYKGWLFLPAGEWSLKTQGIIVPFSKDCSEEEDNAYLNGLIRSLDSDTVEDVVRNVSVQVSKLTSEILFEAFLFYYNNDAFIDLQVGSR